MLKGEQQGITQGIDTLVQTSYLCSAHASVAGNQVTQGMYGG